MIRQNDLEDIRNDIQPKSTEEDEKKIKVQILDDEAKKIKKQWKEKMKALDTIRGKSMEAKESSSFSDEEDNEEEIEDKKRKRSHSKRNGTIPQARVAVTAIKMGGCRRSSQRG